MPADLQQELVHKVPGLEEACIIRPGYAIEYDFVDPRELTPFLETVRVKGLFFAGQINGTTGYEEAACQGLMAGINAALFVQRREGFRLRREESYIGVLIDDLITQGVDEPYRMFTSRAENRLSLRHDTADARLTPYGRNFGLVGDSDWDSFNARRARLAQLRYVLENTRFKRSDAVYQTLCQSLNVDLGDSFTLAQLANRPKVDIALIERILLSSTYSNASRSDLETVFADFLYSGYLESRQMNSELIHQHDALLIPSNLNFRKLSGLSNEMIERFERTCPSTFGQARHIPGITPAALSNLLVHLKLHKTT
jgi:tRNA uridine 5-carboxymethylaminomethyl modification enzyme